MSLLVVDTLGKLPWSDERFPWRLIVELPVVPAVVKAVDRSRLSRLHAAPLDQFSPLANVLTKPDWIAFTQWSIQFDRVTK